MVFVKTHIVDSGANGFGMRYPKKGEMDILKVTHNAGFFSCSTIALQDTVIWHREHKKLPDILDRTHQYAHYKHEPLQNLIPFFFEEKEGDIPYNGWYEISHDAKELQFSDYRLLDFAKATPFVEKYFTPSQHVMDIVSMYEAKYQIDYASTCGVFYRGNDKNRETKIAPYDQFIDKCRSVDWQHGQRDGQFKGSNLKFFVLPDETEFLEAFHEVFRSGVITPEETPHMRKKDSAIPFEMPTVERAEYAAKFLAAVIVMSRCKYLVTHSGNCGMWATLYRGNSDNVFQWQNDKWLR